MTLPQRLSDVDAGFLTRLLHAHGAIAPENRIVDVSESDVGMTAGYFSAIKRMKCTYREPTDAPSSFIVKAWPDFEMAPPETIAEMFARDIKGYLFDEDRFYPRPRVFLADFDSRQNRWALIMEDACTFAEQKLHEQEMGMDEVERMIPRLVELALTWEGCDQGGKARQLDALDVDHWASDANLSTYRNIMPGGARLFDIVSAMPDSSLVRGRTWDRMLGPEFAELFTRKLDAFYGAVKPDSGATCTLAHGDLRGDNLFFSEPSAAYPHGWLTIDFQLLFRGPVPSDLAYLLNSASVLPEVYSGDNRDHVLRSFYDGFMAGTRTYPDYTWDQFLEEYAVMSTVLFVYFVGFGAAVYQAALNDEQPMRVELGPRGDTEADLAADELRKRMWWRKTFANFSTTFKEFGLYDRLSALPENTSHMGEWFEPPSTPT
jgi:hypothetical protein